MANVIINDTNLTNIANAIREKNGLTDTYKPSEMADAIIAIPSGGGGGSGIPEERLILTGDCSAKFQKDNWNWFIEEYGDKITSQNITNATSMFKDSALLTEVPFDLNVSDGELYTIFQNCKALESVGDINYSGGMLVRIHSMFQTCNNLKQIGTLRNFRVYATNNLFKDCQRLRYLPALENCVGGWSTVYNSATDMFANCYSLRSIPSSYYDLVRNSKATSSSYHYFSGMFLYCTSLDEVTNLPVNNKETLNSNVFTYTFDNCARLKNITFETNSDGSPIVVKWQKQTLNLYNVGYSGSIGNILLYNSGITEDKEVNRDTYEALKNDPDWFTRDYYYSRYNHDSAVATINSLPDASAYIAEKAGTANTLKFNSLAGGSTDGGAINTLTEEEIAVATAKGWTVSLV